MKKTIASVLSAAILLGGGSLASAEEKATKLSTPYMDLIPSADSSSATVNPPEWKAVSGAVDGKGKYGKIKLYSSGVAGLSVQEKHGDKWVTMGGTGLQLFEEGGEVTLDYWMDKGKQYRIEVISGLKATGTIRNSL
ncbi:hypothetical protein [Bacillus thuringiensis]|uniref:hypothetical protein n=1 Tax=Bacillus thuringiensis TaxID=1428 RepID=UPI000BFC8483|nr:hypothetical protein [Bacillus thuringiensis]PGW35151.1 hypothetical protein COE17_25175 [Bacillus thuringiensis]